MRLLQARCRWIPHHQMPADGLTKRNGNTVTLIDLMRRGAFRLTDESSELVAREATKKIRGYVPRPHRRYGSTESRELGTDHEPDPDLRRPVRCWLPPSRAVAGIIAPNQRSSFPLSADCTQPEVFQGRGLRSIELAKTGKMLFFQVHVLDEELPERFALLATRSDLLDFGEL